ncbi:MAG: hypothetical protein AAFP97_09540 [Pseudomonadota bacterium]
MRKITYRDYRALIENPDTDDTLIEAYSIIIKGRNAFDFQIRPNPELVEMGEHEVELEDAMATANNISRFRRQWKFKKRVKAGTDLPIIVEEGDSWHQFPILIKDIVDQLEDDYLIYSVGAAGDTAENMVFGDIRHRQTEYMLALRKLMSDGHEVSGFMFSAAGNDIIGEDPDGVSALQNIVRDFNGDPDDIVGHINFTELANRIDRLRVAYLKVVATIRSEPGLHKLPIFVHGYDYVFPHPWDQDDRDPIHAKKNEWLGEPLDCRRIKDLNLRRNIIKFLLDRLYDMLFDMAGDPALTQIWVIDCRGAMPDVSDWIDEIHGTDKGFAKVAARFRATMRQAIAH